MKKYMVVYTWEGDTFASFADTFSEADKTRMDLECGLGEYAEIYERLETEYGEEYKLIC